MKRALLLLWASVSSAFALEQVGFDRYQVIVDRAPFGVPSAAGGPSAPAPGWAESYVFVGVVPDPASTNVLAIIQDKERAYLKGVGDVMGDVKVKEIQAAGRGSKLVLQRGVETTQLFFKDQSAGVPALPQPAGISPTTPAGPILQPVAQGGPMPANVPPRRRIPFRRGE